MNRAVRVLPTLLAIFFISAPLSIVATILLFPFWSWFEATTGIESAGHSGPADWCYVAAFLIFFVAGTAFALMGWQRSGRQ